MYIHEREREAKSPYGYLPIKTLALYHLVSYDMCERVRRGTIHMVSTIYPSLPQHFRQGFSTWWERQTNQVKGDGLVQSSTYDSSPKAIFRELFFFFFLFLFVIFFFWSAEKTYVHTYPWQNTGTGGLRVGRRRTADISYNYRMIHTWNLNAVQTKMDIVLFLFLFLFLLLYGVTTPDVCLRIGLFAVCCFAIACFSFYCCLILLACCCCSLWDVTLCTIDTYILCTYTHIHMRVCMCVCAYVRYVRM